MPVGAGVGLGRAVGVSVGTGLGSAVWVGGMDVGGSDVGAGPQETSSITAISGIKRKAVSEGIRGLYRRDTGQALQLEFGKIHLKGCLYAGE